MCQWVMGGRIALWDELFEKAFLQVSLLWQSAAASLMQWLMEGCCSFLDTVAHGWACESNTEA